MNKAYLIVVFLFSSFAVNAQNENEINVNQYEKKNEIKLNVFAPIIGALEATYERNLSKKSSIGISAFYVYNEEPNSDLNYYISPYYRMYFGKKFSSGFFIEGFGLLSSTDGKKIYDTAEKLTFTENPDVIDFSPGLGFGGKWVTKIGIVYEVNFGWAKPLFNSEKTDHDQIVKLGVSLGYRF